MNFFIIIELRGKYIYSYCLSNLYISSTEFFRIKSADKTDAQNFVLYKVVKYGTI